MNVAANAFIKASETILNRFIIWCLAFSFCHHFPEAAVDIIIINVGDYSSRLLIGSYLCYSTFCNSSVFFWHPGLPKTRESIAPHYLCQSIVHFFDLLFFSKAAFHTVIVTVEPTVLSKARDHVIALQNASCLCTVRLAILRR